MLCRVNDRGPAPGLGRAIDLTPAAFSEIAGPARGLAFVMIEPLREESAFRRIWTREEFRG